MWRHCWRKTTKHINVKHKATVLLWIYAIKFNNHNMLWNGLISRKSHYIAKLASKILLSLANTWMYSWHVLDTGDESWMACLELLLGCKILFHENWTSLKQVFNSLLFWRSNPACKFPNILFYVGRPLLFLVTPAPLEVPQSFDQRSLLGLCD